MIPDLPPELLLQIVETLAEIKAVDHKTLRHLCLTNKLLLPSARAALYSRAALTFSDTDRSATSSMAQSMWMEDEEEDERISSDGALLLQTLEAAPHLAHLVQRVSLNLANQFSSAMVLPTLSLQTLLSLCPNIRHLRFRGNINEGEGEPLMQHLLAVLPPLEELEVFVTSDAVTLLQRLPTLQHLLVYPAEDVWYQEATVHRHQGQLPSFPFALTSLIEVNGIPSLPQHLLEPFTRISKQTLSNLRLSCPTFIDLGPHLTAFELLSHLHLTLQNSDTNSKAEDDLVTAMLACTSLKTLILDNHSIRPLSPSLISRLPTRLISVRIQGKLDITTLAHLVGEPSRSALKQVALNGRADWQQAETLARLHGWEVHSRWRSVRMVR